MPPTANPAEYCRCEADRLRGLAGLPSFRDVRERLLAMAGQYDILARQRERLCGHDFGQPFQNARS